MKSCSRFKSGQPVGGVGDAHRSPAFLLTQIAHQLNGFRSGELVGATGRPRLMSAKRGFATLPRAGYQHHFAVQICCNEVIRITFHGDDFNQKCRKVATFVHSWIHSSSRSVRARMRGRRRFRLGCLPQQPILRTAIDRLGFIVQERQTINYHVSATIRMLEQLPWPKHLKNVPDYAGGHHERTDGKGTGAASRASK